MKRKIATLWYLLLILLFLPAEALLAYVLGLPLLIPVYLQNNYALTIAAVVMIVLYLIAITACACSDFGDEWRGLLVLMFVLSICLHGICLSMAGLITLGAFFYMFHIEDFIVDFYCAFDFDFDDIPGSLKNFLVLILLSSVLFCTAHYEYTFFMEAIFLGEKTALLDIVNLRVLERIDSVISIIGLAAFVVSARRGSE